MDAVPTFETFSSLRTTWRYKSKTGTLNACNIYTCMLFAGYVDVTIINDIQTRWIGNICCDVVSFTHTHTQTEPSVVKTKHTAKNTISWKLTNVVPKGIKFHAFIVTISSVRAQMWYSLGCDAVLFGGSLENLGGRYCLSLQGRRLSQSSEHEAVDSKQICGPSIQNTGPAFSDPIQ